MIILIKFVYYIFYPIFVIKVPKQATKISKQA